MPSSGFKTCARSEEHTSELQSHDNLVCRLLLEKNKQQDLKTRRRQQGIGRRRGRLAARRVVAARAPTPLGRGFELLDGVLPLFVFYQTQHGHLPDSPPPPPPVSGH